MDWQGLYRSLYPWPPLPYLIVGAAVIAVSVFTIWDDNRRYGPLKEKKR